jgi:hypothetical protein
MGGETSKLQAPEEFGQSGNQFQIVSPVSDLSCPSDIHRINRLRNQHRGQADPSRRLSKTVTKTLSNKNHAGGVPQPARFYFPTKETEKTIHRAERGFSDREDKENQKKNILRKTKKVSKQVLKKTQNAIMKTHQAMQGCFADDHAANLEAAQRVEETKHHPTLGIARKVLPKNINNVSDEDAKPSYEAMDDPSATPVALRNARPTHVGYHVPSTQKKPYSHARPPLESDHNEGSFKHPAIHEADDYFSRLSGGSSDASPYVENKVKVQAMPVVRPMPVGRGSKEPDSPVSNLFVDNGSDEDSRESSWGERNIQQGRHSRSSKVTEGQNYTSPTAALLAYQRAIGTTAETPGYYPEDEDGDDTDPPLQKKPTKTAEELVDEITEKATRALATIAEKADDEYSNTSTSQSMGKNTKSAFRPRLSSQTKIQSLTMTALSSYDGSDRKVSKLESLFRPVMPAWSADDAQTVHSYDRYEIKVTESAPSVLEGKHRTSDIRREMTDLEKKLNGYSPSMTSIDSQASTAMTTSMLSKQAQNNGDFLFSAAGHQVKTFKSMAQADMASIDTLGSRNRLSNRLGARAMVIKDKKALLAADELSQYTKDADRHARFSLLDAVTASVGLAPKESIDVPSTESRMTDLAEVHALETVNKENAKGPWPYKKATNSREASINVSEIQNKVSDLTEDSGSYRERTSTGTASSVPETFHDEAENPEIVPGEPQQVHWSYSIKDGDISAVTPHFGKGLKNATNSPYLRFENAKSKFGANQLAAGNKVTALVKKETSIVKRKDIPIKSPRSNKIRQGIKLRPLQSGGSVATKIEVLNQRVVEAKIDRKLHRWTKSNPRKYAVVESNAVRTRAIVQYKTNVVGLERLNYMSAAKFNAIPIDDDESSICSSAEASRQSKKSVTFADQQPSSLLQMPSKQSTVAEYEDDEASKLSTDDMSKLTMDSHSTFRRDHSYMPKGYTAKNRVSESTYSTTSSGVTNIKKQIFRGSAAISETGLQSVASKGESTTMSSILEKENTNYSQFRADAKTVKPNEQSNITTLSPVPAQKWRSLAAAAHVKDSQKRPNSANTRQGLAVKNRNVLAAYGY